ncbi:ParB/RepB/Spo0J family partition protein [Arthrobacter sp. JZ12]|uniref:ParB/RepB/Spo0J family partition protein n=1 Tax=Arthrobacter sp. JZ12 TaxID=2654190 RepID=UPI002B47B2CF|nr:ParB/RepB/Spo0J family partition protein [Arthrobacter sp. JZ12]
MPEKRRGLGRGLGALIPSGVEEERKADSGTGRANERGRPVDLFFPSGNGNGARQGQADVDGLNGAAPSKSAINKDALTAPAKRSGGRAGSPRKATSEAPRKAKPAPAPEEAPEKPQLKASVKERGATEAERTEALEAPANESVASVAPTKDDEIALPAIREESDEEQVDEEKRALADSGDLPDSGAEVSRETLKEVPGARFAELPVLSIHPNRKQPRSVFDEDEMAELVHSIREIGVLQPIVVRRSAEGGEQAYELVMGERRWRATKEAGLETVPAIIRDTTDDDLLRDALLENLHRSQLNPLEEAAAYQQLLDDFGCSQEELASRIGRSRPQISNTLRLMKLPPLVQRRLAAGVLSAGHARALLGLSDPAEMEKLAQRIVAEGLSVRSTEEIVAMSDGLRRPAKQNAPRAGARHERLDYLATSLSDRLDTNVKITLGAKKGRVSIEFASVDDLNRIMGVLNPS